MGRGRKGNLNSLSIFVFLEFCGRLSVYSIIAPLGGGT
uniref:Uncharacterized protein n=1 Tax=Rhizophora mucronata TaxID=61149 RepID=A0A2P2R107_RHIMU